MESFKLQDPVQVVDQIISFIKSTYAKANKTKAVIAVSGGLDSAVSLTLLTKALGEQAVFPVLLPFQDQDMSDAKEIVEWNNISVDNTKEISITGVVDQLERTLFFGSGDKLRLGNMMARTRMIAVYDLAKSLDALVCGTENKSEHHLGYFTRFGDGASDLEPLLGLYKTQVRQLAKHLEIPQEIIDKDPSAGLWQGQVDEDELGFTYDDADRVMWQMIDQQKKQSEVRDVDPQVIQKVVERMEKMSFKHQVPYVLE